MTYKHDENSWCHKNARTQNLTLFSPVCSIIHTNYNYFSQSHQFFYC